LRARQRTKPTLPALAAAFVALAAAFVALTSTVMALTVVSALMPVATLIDRTAAEGAHGGENEERHEERGYGTRVNATGRKSHGC
jgi:hypothetical protein